MQRPACRFHVQALLRHWAGLAAALPCRLGLRHLLPAWRAGMPRPCCPALAWPSSSVDAAQGPWQEDAAKHVASCRSCHGAFKAWHCKQHARPACLPSARAKHPVHAQSGSGWGRTAARLLQLEALVRIVHVLHRPAGDLVQLRPLRVPAAGLGGGARHAGTLRAVDSSGLPQAWA